MPDRVSNSPQGCQYKENVILIWIWHPVEQNSDHNDVEASAEDEDRNPSDDLDDCAEPHGEDRITNAVSDHHVTHVVNAPSACNESLNSWNVSKVNK